MLACVSRALLAALVPDVIVDGRVRKRHHPETQRELVPLTIGLGPNVIAGDTTDWPTKGLY